MRTRRPRERPPGRKAGKSENADAPVRVQKLLSAAGIGSRREVERWIREGRLMINGEVPELGTRLEPRDRITLDGRPVRLGAAVKLAESHVLLFNRSPGAALDLDTLPASIIAAPMAYVRNRLDRGIFRSLRSCVAESGD